MVSVIRGNDDFDSSGGVSTTYNDVGTYWHGGSDASATNLPGTTIAASNLIYGGGQYPAGSYNISGTAYALSGTWRLMGGNPSNSVYYSALWVRVS